MLDEIFLVKYWENYHIFGIRIIVVIFYNIETRASIDKNPKLLEIKKKL